MVFKFIIKQIFLFFILSQVVRAESIKGHVLNTIRDDEGLKVIVESNEILKKNDKKSTQKKKTYSLYLPGTDNAFVEKESLLTEAKGKNKTVVFEIKKNGLMIIEKLKLEK